MSRAGSRLIARFGIGQRRFHADYAQWCEAVEPSESDLRRLRAEGDAAAGVTLSVVMPVFNPRLPHLEAAIDSVRSQSYARWTLCVCDDASTEPAVGALLERYARLDSRIRVCRRDENGGIAAASADALALADGEFIALLDQDDRLPPWALHFVADALVQRPDADLVYSDEDKLADDGTRFSPHFKPDWNPELLHSINYFGHLLVIRRSLVDRAGGFRAGFDGSQDYDLILRCIRLTVPERIAHVPAVLYHWRAARGSTARSVSAKPYAHEAGIRALRAHLADQPGVSVEDGPFPTSYRVRHPQPTPAPLVSVIVPTRDGGERLKRCIASVLEPRGDRSVEVIVVNNRSREPGTLDELARLRGHPQVRVFDYEHDFNYAAINNFAAKQARGDVLLLLNDDVEAVSADWFEEMLSQLCCDGVGAVGAKLHYADGRIQHAGVILGIGGVAGHSHKYFPGSHPGYFGRLVLPQTVSALTGACLMVRAETYRAVGGLDEDHLRIAFNDVDFCLRLRERGLRCVWTPYARLIHHESASRGPEDTPDKRARFARERAYMKRRWQGGLLSDPCYSPNLSLEREDFSLREDAQPYIRQLRVSSAHGMPA